MGWAKANLRFDVTRKLPEPGSPAEILFLLIWKMRQDIEFQKSRSLMQALLSQTGAQSSEILKSFSDLKDSFYPFEKNQQTDEKRRLREQLMREVARGPISIQPMMDLHRPKIQSKLGRGAEALRQRATLHREGRISQIDQFDRARRRPRTAS